MTRLPLGILTGRTLRSWTSTEGSNSVTVCTIESDDFLPTASVAYIVYYAKAGKVCRFDEARLVDAKEAIEDMIEDGEVFDCLPTDLKL